MGSEPTTQMAAKIPSPELYRMATEGTGDAVSVIVEPAIPSQQVQFEVDPRRPGEQISRRFAVVPPEDEEANERTVDQVRSFLEETVGESPRWLRAARAFVVKVTPQQLHAIAQSPLVKMIRPNRQLSYQP